MIQLTPIQKKFIIHWGEMGERWGINRTIAQIHGLLYLSPEPLNAEEISETLSVARSTVSVGLHELQSWGIIKVVHTLGDRTDRFEIKGDVWEMFRWIVDYRKRREVDPTLEALRDSVAQLEQNQEDEHTKQKMGEMLELFETADSLYAQAQNVSTRTIVRIARMSDIVAKLLRLFPD
ncbi:MAG: HTH domain-containing protein [Anaerolineales bacterium]|nr:HTH domain-containing protein [Anaerolineales bacterium]